MIDFQDIWSHDPILNSKFKLCLNLKTQLLSYEYIEVLQRLAQTPTKIQEHAENFKRKVVNVNYQTYRRLDGDTLIRVKN